MKIPRKTSINDHYNGGWMYHTAANGYWTKNGLIFAHPERAKLPANITSWLWWAIHMKSSVIECTSFTFRTTAFNKTLTVNFGFLEIRLMFWCKLHVDSMKNTSHGCHSKTCCPLTATACFHPSTRRGINLVSPHPRHSLLYMDHFKKLQTSILHKFSLYPERCNTPRKHTALAL